MNTLEAPEETLINGPETLSLDPLPSLWKGREYRQVETNPATGDGQITDITPLVWPLVLEAKVAPFQTALFTLTLQEGASFSLTAFAVHDIDLRLRDRFGVPVAEDLREGGMSHIEWTPLSTGEYLLEVINRTRSEEH